MPERLSSGTNDPGVARLYLAHEVAQAEASESRGGDLRINIGKYLETFDKVYKAIAQTIYESNKESGA